MYDLRTKLKPLTEEEKSLVRNYFETWDDGGWWESRLWFTYGRMRAHGETISKAEEYLASTKQRKMDSYKSFKEQEISNGLRAYLNDHNEPSEYEFMKLNNWISWRTLVIGILDYDGKKIAHVHAVEIEEASNPEYFKECMMRYAPNQALSNDKPF